LSYSFQRRLSLPQSERIRVNIDYTILDRSCIQVIGLYNSASISLLMIDISLIMMMYLSIVQSPRNWSKRLLVSRSVRGYWKRALIVPAMRLRVEDPRKQSGCACRLEPKSAQRSSSLGLRCRCQVVKEVLAQGTRLGPIYRLPPECSPTC
jgi:hypothetical protein